jgi:NADPH2:quinone reductase
MKAIRVHELGGPEVLRYEDVADPKPEADQVLVKIEAVGVNYLDVYYRAGFHWGGHHPRPLPYIPGAEAAGTVAEIGVDVTELKVGDRVAYGISNGQGSYAELIAVPAWHLFKVPAPVENPIAAAAMLQGMTAHYLTHSTYPVKTDDAVLVHAAAGGTGLLLIQMAKMRGAKVLGTVSSAQKVRVATAAGADAVVNYVTYDFAAEVRRLTAGRGVNVVYDSVGQATFEKSLDCLAPLGALVLFGQASGPVPPFDTAILNAKGSLTLARPSLTHNVANRADVLNRAGDLFGWIESGKLKITIGRSFPLSQAAQAHRELESRRTTGKIILIP